MEQKDIDRFWSKVRKTDWCWLWTAGRLRGGYGRMRADGKMMFAHRLSWMINRGDIPIGKCVCHNCKPLADNPACVNPAHLWLGTPADNVRDRNEKGRTARGEKISVLTRGEKSGSHKVTEIQVREIRSRKGENQRLLGLEYSLDQSTISKIMLGKTWRHLK